MPIAGSKEAIELCRQRVEKGIRDTSDPIDKYVRSLLGEISMMIAEDRAIIDPNTGVTTAFNPSDQLRVNVIIETVNSMMKR